MKTQTLLDDYCSPSCSSTNTAFDKDVEKNLAGEKLDDVPTPKRSGEWEDLSEYEKDNVITVLTIMISSLVLWVTVPSLGALLDENIRECMDRSVYKRLVYLLLSLTVPACLALFFTFGRLVANCLGWYLGRDDRLGWNWEMLGSPSDEVLPCERA